MAWPGFRARSHGSRADGFRGSLYAHRVAGRQVLRDRCPDRDQRSVARSGFPCLGCTEGCANRHPMGRDPHAEPPTRRAGGTVILLLGLPALLSMWLRAPTQVPAYGDAGSAASPRQSAASISGTVVTLAKKPEPIAGATVVVRRIDPARQSAPDDIDGGSTTDQQGRFVISGLTAGTYELRAAKPGYVPTEYDATRPGEVGRGVVLASGQSLAGLTVTLPRAGVISGTVVDGAGVPVARLPVAARRASSPTSTVRTVLTDHLGAYRLHGLPPGEYLVVASPADRAAVPVEAPSGGGIGDYAPVFYPGTINADQAARVKVDAGIETDAIDLLMVRSGTTQIAGVVFDVDGQPAVGAIVSLSSAGGVQ